MLDKSPNRETVSASADAADQFINSFKPFAETLAERLTGSAKARRRLSNGFLAALDRWSLEVGYDKIVAICKTLQKTKDCAIALREQRDEALHLMSSFRQIQDQALVNEIPPPTSLGLLHTLSLAIEIMETWIKKHEMMKEAETRRYQRTMGIDPGDESSRGRPGGISGYPRLEILVFLLEFHNAFHGAFLTAYIKKNGELKVAAGSLIDALNTLRSYLVNDQLYFWLANSLPLPDEHLTFVSTYQRNLADARFEARDQQAARLKHQKSGCR